GARAGRPRWPGLGPCPSVPSVEAGSRQAAAGTVLVHSPLLLRGRADAGLHLNPVLDAVPTRLDRRPDPDWAPRRLDGNRAARVRVQDASPHGRVITRLAPFRRRRFRRRWRGGPSLHAHGADGHADLHPGAELVVGRIDDPHLDRAAVRFDRDRAPEIGPRHVSGGDAPVLRPRRQEHRLLPGQDQGLGGLGGAPGRHFLGRAASRAAGQERRDEQDPRQRGHRCRLYSADRPARRAATPLRARIPRSRPTARATGRVRAAQVALQLPHRPFSTAVRNSAACRLKSAGSSILIVWPLIGRITRPAWGMRRRMKRPGSRQGSSWSPTITRVGIDSLRSSGSSTKIVFRLRMTPRIRCAAAGAECSPRYRRNSSHPRGSFARKTWRVGMAPRRVARTPIPPRSTSAASPPYSARNRSRSTVPLPQPATMRLAATSGCRRPKFRATLPPIDSPPTWAREIPSWRRRR